MTSLGLAVGIAAAAMTWSASALAGGYDEAPHQGAQALGRGGAFTAKADDGSALLYNVAGLAGQRGTKVMLGANLQLSSFSFRRAGRYPGDPADPATPFAGRAYPVVENEGTPRPLPMLVATTDLGLERLTLAAGVMAPTANAGKRFAGTVSGAPSPARYDTVSEGSTLIVYPTLAAAYAITPDLFVGVAGHLVLARFDVSNVAYVDSGSCKSAEDPRCDARARLGTSGTTFAASIGALARASRSVHLGAQVRTPSSIMTSGQAQTTSSAELGGKALPTSEAKLAIALPWVFRAGARYVSHDGDVERYDLEIDGVYEAWGSAQAGGPRVWIADAGLGKPSFVESYHRWQDTVSVRFGGAYNVDLGENVLTLRGGASYESPTTAPEDTRIDVDTLAKVGSGLGLGLRAGAWSFGLAYAATASVPRAVDSGAFVLRSATSTPAKNAAPPPVLNEGTFEGFSHTFSLSMEVDLSRLFGAARAPEAPAAREPGESRLPKRPRETVRSGHADAPHPHGRGRDELPARPGGDAARDAGAGRRT